MLRRSLSPSLSVSPSLCPSLSLCSLETLVAGWLAHAFWIARQIYAPPLVCAGTGNGQRLRLAPLGSVCLPASLCVHVSVCACVCVCESVACLLAFINPLRVARLCVCVCVCATLLKMLWQISVCIIRFQSAQHGQRGGEGKYRRRERGIGTFGAA